MDLLANPGFVAPGEDASQLYREAIGFLNRRYLIGCVMDERGSRTAGDCYETTIMDWGRYAVRPGGVEALLDADAVSAVRQMTLLAPLFQWPVALRQLSIFEQYGAPLVDGHNVIVANLTRAADAIVAPAGNAGGIAAGTITCRALTDASATVRAAAAGCVPINVLGPNKATAAAIDYIKAGLARCERCFYICCEHDVPQLRAALRKAGVHVETEERRTALVLVAKDQGHLTGGTFDPERMIDLLRRGVDLFDEIIDVSHGPPARWASRECSRECNQSGPCAGPRPLSPR